MTCSAIKLDGQVCGLRTKDGATLCTRHAKLERKRQIQETVRRLWNQLADNIWIHDITDLDFLMIPVYAAVATNELPEELILELQDVAAEEIVARTRAFPLEPVEDNRPELQRIADDRQNVHTGPVNQQTNTSLARLLETPVSARQDTLKEIWRYTKKKRIQKDMEKWYSVESCRQDGDWLYKRALDGLWARIKTSEHRDELTKRLLEEVTESVSMCCDGHIARLCNVLVGFDDLFVPQVSTGEALQQKMSAISMLDLSVEEKVFQAWEVFEELAIPMEEREAWVEAF